MFIGSIPLDFIFFALTLLGIALSHKCTLQVALAGFASTVIYKISFSGFNRDFPLGFEMITRLFLRVFSVDWRMNNELFKRKKRKDAKNSPLALKQLRRDVQWNISV